MASLLAATLVGALLTSGCLRSPPPEASQRPSLVNPRWNERPFRRHLNFFEGALREGDTPASAPVADYVSASLHEAWLQPAVEGRYRLRPLFGRASGYAGYVGGKNPPFAKEAVLVCADLGEAPPAVGAAALLEVARVYGTASQYAVIPERSVIFALWPRLAAQDDPLAGLRAYLHRPTWSLDHVRAVLYVGLPASLRGEAQALLDDYDIPLQRVHAAAPGNADNTAAARPAPRGGASPAARAQALAERTHRQLRAATLTGGRMMPALGDSIRVPHSRQR